MQELLKSQKFGVEIEFTGITRATAAKIVATELRSQASKSTGGCYDTRNISDASNRVWKVMRDSSIHEEKKNGTASDLYKVEFVTPPLHYEDIDTLQNIIRHFRKAGAIVNSSCGIHIHIDGANHSSSSLRRLVNFTVARQDLIYAALNVNSRRSRYCQPLNENLLIEMKRSNELTTAAAESIWYSTANDNYNYGVDHSHYNSTRYHGINLHSFFSKGTVEFRLFNSTLHAGKVKAYIQFCLAVSAWSITSNDSIHFRKIDGYTPAKKVTLMYNILTNRLGLTGNEFKTCRLHMLENLKKARDSAVNSSVA